MRHLIFSLLLSCSALGVATAQDLPTSADGTERNDSVNFDILMQNLPEVMVKGEQPVARLERGRLTYNMPLLLNRIPADNAFDALRNIPGVSVDNNQVKFAGQPITLVLNGKVTAMGQEELMERLKMLPSDRLQNAQIMLAAPANLHVRGAVINVVTKDFSSESRTSGQIVGAFNQSKYGTGATQLNLLHSTKKLMLDANYSFRNGLTYGEAEHEAQHPLGDERIPYYDLTTNKSRNISHNYRLGLDYSFTERHRLSLAYNGSWKGYDSDNRTTGDSRSAQASDGHVYLHNVDADYTLPFGLRLSASYLSYEHSKQQMLNGSIYETAKNLLADSNQEIDKWLFAADQSHEVRHGWGVSYGAKAQFARNNSWQTTSTNRGETLPEATSDVDIDERIVNAYVGVCKQWSDRLSMDASVTVENFHSPQWDEWRVYPTVNVLWMADADNLFNLSFSSDATYPDYWSTMSSINYSSTYSEIWGNPYLKPSSTYDVSLMWQWKRRYVLSAFAMLRPNSFVQLPYQPDDRMAVVMREVNFDHRNTFGLQASAQYSAGKWLNGNVSLVALYNQDKCGDFFDIPFNRDKFVLVASGTAAATISQRANLRLVLSPFFQTDAVQGVYDIERMFTLNASLRWMSRSRKWNLALEGNNLTNRHFQTVSTWKNQNFGMRVCQDWVNVSLKATYKFGDYKERKVKTVDTSRMGY